uniref:Ankyrin repeat protein SKIP35 n=1 Tax=Aegilops tauschii TaxID=37682 RepID=N1QV12_AEGTA
MSYSGPTWQWQLQGVPLDPRDSKTSKVLVAKEPRSVSTDFGDEQDLELGSGEPEPDKQQERKLSRQDRIELSRLFQHAVSSHDWECTDGFLGKVDAHGFNDVLCMAVDAIWFLSDKEELYAIVSLIKRIVSAGVNDFTCAALRTSFLASCVSACRGRTTSLADAVNFMGQKLHEHLQESHGDEVLKAEASAKVHKFTEWALKCIGLHARVRESWGKGNHGTIIDVQLHLRAFKTFLDIADNDLTAKDFTKAFDAACFPLKLFSSTFDQGWAAGISAAAIQGLLELLVEGGADNVSQYFLEAARYGSTEPVRILLQITQRNSFDIDVDLALSFAAHYGKLENMGCLVEEVNTIAFLGPLMRAAEHGCLQVVECCFGISRSCSFLFIVSPLSQVLLSTACVFSTSKVLLLQDQSRCRLGGNKNYQARSCCVGFSPVTRQRKRRWIQEVEKMPFSLFLNYRVPRLDLEVQLRRTRHSQGWERTMEIRKVGRAQVVSTLKGSTVDNPIYLSDHEGRGQRLRACLDSFHKKQPKPGTNLRRPILEA